MPLPLLWNKLISFGRRSEIAGVEYLNSIGYRVVACGYRTRNGEVDIVAWEQDVLTFIEVKARRSADPPEDAVGHRKRERVVRAAQNYLARHGLNDVRYRFDVLSITVLPGAQPSFRLIRDAYRMPRA
jgi:putative endonuclease